MSRTEQVAQILIYLFTPEDTTEKGTIKKGVGYLPQNTRCPHLGFLKVSLWLAIAVAGPIIIIMFLSWVG